MKKFNDYITEDLTGALVEPQSPSAQEAKRLGLVYVGFGRYENPQSQQVTHIVQDDKLVPFNKALKTNKFKKASSDDFGSYAKNLKPDIDQIHESLIDHYAPENYDEYELAAVEMYTGPEYLDINEKLYSLPTGVPADQIEAEYDGDEIPSTIAALDSALNKTKTPIEFLTYISLSNSYNIEDFANGKKFRFKGYRSTSLDPNIAINFGAKGSSDKKRMMVMQLLVKKGSKGMYVDDFSSTPGEGEFLLPRGSSVQITGGPNKIVGSNAYTNELSHQVMLFTAELVKNK